MPTSEARILANQANAARSTGPKTVEGKEISRRNSLKHGMTGAGVVLSEADAAEVAYRTVCFADELGAVGEVGRVLVRRAALHSVRMERGEEQQTAALTLRIRQVEADFVAPEGVDDAEAARLRHEAIQAAMFNPSKEANLARQYEAAAERGFYKAMKQLRQWNREAEVETKADDDALMASFLAQQQASRKQYEEFEAMLAETNKSQPARPSNSTQTAVIGGVTELPITIGRPR